MSYSDVLCGDVFSLQFGFYHEEPTSYIGVLITQPCDCVIREDKGRTKRKAHNFELVLFKDKECTRDNLLAKGKSDWKKLIREIRNEGIFIGKTPSGNGNWSARYICAADLVTAIQIPSFILDLTSVSSQGMAQIISNEDLHEVILQKKTQNWTKYFHEFNSSINNFISTQDMLIKCAADYAEKILCEIYGIPFSLKKNAFEISRIGHLETNLIELISHHYIAHSYRVGKNSLIALHNPSEQGEV